MITDLGDFYLYRHIRLDKNEPFYVGIGTKDYKNNGFSIHYNEAIRKDRDNKIWKAITNKTKWKVEILLESDDYEFIKQKEIEFVSLYGRIDLGTGILSNLTNGGEGCYGFKPTVGQLEKMKIAQSKNYKRIIGVKINDNSIHNFKSVTEASQLCNTTSANIRKSCKEYKKSKDGKLRISSKGFTFHYEKDDNLSLSYKYSKGFNSRDMKNTILANIKTVYQYDKKFKLIKKWDSCIEADRFYKLKDNYISCIAGRNKRLNQSCTANGFIWLYDIVEKVGENKRKNGVITPIWKISK